MKKLTIISLICLQAVFWACRSNYVIVKHQYIDKNGKTEIELVKQYLTQGYILMMERSFLANRIYLNGCSGKVIYDGPNIMTQKYISIDTSAKKFKFTELEINKSYRKIPKAFFISKFEETVDQYNEYLFCLKRDSPINSYLEAIPDTMSFQKEHIINYCEPFIGSLYFRHPAFRNYPIVGISWVEAKRYCIWKSIYITKRICELEHIPFNKDNLLITYRLPTLTEWEYAARYNKWFKRSFHKGANWKLDKMFPGEKPNWYIPKKTKKVKSYKMKYINEIYPYPVNTQISNQNTQLFNMNNNVSEWVVNDSANLETNSRKFIFVGGSNIYPNPEPECLSRIYKIQFPHEYINRIPVFVKTSPVGRAFSTVGFRCVMEVREK